jgi:hypothetical protein
MTDLRCRDHRDLASPSRVSHLHKSVIATELGVALFLIITQQIGRREMVFQVHCAKLTLLLADLPH